MERAFYKDIYQVKRAVEDYLSHLYLNGGEININFSLKYESHKENPRNMLRLSSSGKCPRMIAYSLHFPEKAEIPSPRAISVFQLGHFLHELERYIISEVTYLKSVEDEVYIEVKGKENDFVKVFGHVDGILQLEDREVLIDIKTLNDKSYKEMLNEVKRDYLYQLNAYMYATGLREAYLWIYNKDTSLRDVVYVPYVQSIVDEILEMFSKIVSSDVDNLPERLYSPKQEIRNKEPTGRLYLPWQCSYCPFTDLCYPDFTKVIEDGKIRYIKVQEDIFQGGDDEEELFI